MRVNTLCLLVALRATYSQPVESTGSEPETVRKTEDPSSDRYDSDDDYFRDDDGMFPYMKSTFPVGDASEFDDHFMKEWEALMNNFNPDMLVTVPVGARSDEFFYEDVTQIGVLIRGAYFVIGSENSKTRSGVDFVITDPDGKVVHEKKDQVEGVFSLKTEKKGTYSIMVGNHKWMSTKQVTVLMGVGESKALKKQDLNSVSDGITKVDGILKEIQSESSYMWIKQKSHMKAVSAMNSSIYWYYLVEFLILLIVSSVQIYYVRRLLSNKRLF